MSPTYGRPVEGFSSIEGCQKKTFRGFLIRISFSPRMTHSRSLGSRRPLEGIRSYEFFTFWRTCGMKFNLQIVFGVNKTMKSFVAHKRSKEDLHSCRDPSIPKKSPKKTFGEYLTFKRTSDHRSS